MANDGITRSEAKLLRVGVRNVADGPVFSTTITAFSIPENTDTIGSFAAVDPGGSAVTYRLSGVDAALFSYNNGNLSFNSAPDYERDVSAAGNNMYAVSIISTNTQGSTSLNLTIEVTDVIAGDFDNTFGPSSQGFATYNLSTSTTGTGSYDYGTDVALTPDGKLVVVGYTTGLNRATADLAVWRLNADGSLDPGFGVNGVFTHHNAAGGNGFDRGNSIALTADGKIVVVGESDGVSGTLDIDMAVWKLNANGSLDTSFNQKGFLSHHNAAGGNSNDVGRSVALTADGNGNLDKIVISGYSDGIGTSSDMTVWCLNADGSVDSSFGSTKQGVMSHHNAAGGDNNDSGRSLALTTDSSGKLDKIVVVGESWGKTINGIANRIDMAAWRLNADGSLDTSFGATNLGFMSHHNAAGGEGHDWGAGVALTTDSSGKIDKIVVVGTSVGRSVPVSGTPYDMVTWRLNADGSLDTSFNQQGYMSHHNAAGGGGSDYGNSVALTADGKIVLAGHSFGLPWRGLAVWRLNTDGSLDASFGATRQGFMSHNNTAGGGGYEIGESVRLTANGRIVVVGYSTGVPSNGDDMAVWIIRD